MSKTMMLSEKFTPSKLNFPVYVSRKYDGVPVRIQYNNDTEEYEAWSRQGNKITSISHILKAFDSNGYVDINSAFIGELIIEGKPFKEVSGLVRRSEPCTDLVLMLFDADPPLADDFKDRLLLIKEAMEGFGTSVQSVYQAECHTLEEIEYIQKCACLNKWEGIMIRNHRGLYHVGKRSWGMQKWKPEPTVDLKVVGFEEAVVSRDRFDEETGEQIAFKGTPLGRVGRINCEYKGKIIGVGAGKMKHTEAKEVWNNQDKYIGMIAEVKYMKDDTYDALRQPTFQHWRDDKDEPNFE